MENEKEVQQLLAEMTEALQEANETQERYSTKLAELIKENEFLSETIVKHKLGLITTERRKIIEENEKLKRELSLLRENDQAILEKKDTDYETVPISLEERIEWARGLH